MKQQSHSVTAEDDTKEAIASAFLNREDRNRFIGEVYTFLIVFAASHLMQNILNYQQESMHFYPVSSYSQLQQFTPFT